MRRSPALRRGEAGTFVLCDIPMMVVAANTSRNYSINTHGQKLRQGFDGTFARPRKVEGAEKTPPKL